jgi:hypothetical protein
LNIAGCQIGDGGSLEYSIPYQSHERVGPGSLAENNTEKYGVLMTNYDGNMIDKRD